VEITIREYLSLATPGTSTGAMLNVLELVGLSERIATLPNGLDTQLASSGWPLSIGEVMALNLASALLSRPKVLILSRLFDVMPVDRLRRALDALRETGTTTLLCTGRPEALTLDGWFWLGRHEQRRFESLSQLQNYLAEREGYHAASA
jgi:putative ABC transport system ATP-binding protein